ncbi:MAG: histidinol dehydrogenase [Acidimicrobiia bacterium]|nr:histidinol dehydrogenase [Acidimicrobiia bacterium]MBT8193821.1 histidinol dehydrogenase [Acidimicrobiia bacterium]NNF89209.1 histidinol dehydrogenase [Acidimicrobiia bacterium]NNJ48006.1 histidinol dehydrogenase [Acidimicrobiia bacterium]NNL12613.1 histidinol dehydrogenase [Acidimicrobiia bacterium]
MTMLLPDRSVEELTAGRGRGVDAEALAVAASIIHRIENGGVAALEALTIQFDERPDGMSLFLTADDLTAALESIPDDDRQLLERTAARIRAFAEAQLATLAQMDGRPVPGGLAGQVVAPVERAGCYSPGGRYPLPSSVLMTAVTARTAGVDEVWVASPRPTAVTLAAAAVAGADGLLVAGGAHAIAALAFGAGPVPAADVVVGPGNRFVTAAKQLVFGRVGIDMLAGPSELVVLADDSADEAMVAADLIAQAEHDPEAVPVLVTTDPGLPDRVRSRLEEQLADLPTADIASPALRGGGAVIAADMADAIAACDALAPEHLQLSVRSPETIRDSLGHYGAVFVGEGSAEVFGDYGVGPNHVLPTGGTARFTGGLSVFTFLRTRTWLQIDPRNELIDDVARLARLEGLEGHARAAEARRSGK